MGVLSEYEFNAEYINRLPRTSGSLYRKVFVIIGVGGVGSWVAFFLNKSFRRSFENKLILIDPDIVNEHNRSRTPYFNFQVGMYKVDALEQILLLDRLDSGSYIEKYYGKFDLKLKEELEEKYGNKLVYVDCRDTVDYITELSPIVGGYDGDAVTIEINPKFESHWQSGLPIRYNVPSYVCPPVFIASIIVAYLLSPKKQIEKNITITVDHILDFVIGNFSNKEDENNA